METKQTAPETTEDGLPEIIDIPRSVLRLEAALQAQTPNADDQYHVSAETQSDDNQSAGTPPTQRMLF